MTFKITEAARLEIENVLETKQNPDLFFRVYIRGFG